MKVLGSPGPARARSAMTILVCAAALAGAPVSAAGAADTTLIEAARKEGSVTWYTTQIVNQFVRPAAVKFQEKYGIKVDYVRADSNDVALRVFNEARAGHIVGDVIDGTGVVASLKPEHLALQWTPDSAARLPKDYVDPEGYWVGTNVYVLTPGYNTTLVPQDAVPKAFSDLLDPQWKGKLVWSIGVSSSAAAGFIGLVLKSMGEEQGLAYLRKLAQQDVGKLYGAARVVLDRVIAGDYAIALSIFNNHAVISADKGAPVGWIAMNPAMTVLSVVGVTKDAPHANAAKLLADFLVSPEGQAIYRDADYIPVDPAVPPRVASLRPDGDKFRAISFTPEQIVANMPNWLSVYKDIFQ
jgi:iron(III) transport system substrate-binding protein